MGLRALVLDVVAHRIEVEVADAVLPDSDDVASLAVIRAAILAAPYMSASDQKRLTYNI